MSDIVYTRDAVDASFVKFDGTNLVQAGIPIPNVGGSNTSTIALDTDGTPFYSPQGTSAVALDTDGNPYVTDAAMYVTAASVAATTLAKANNLSDVASAPAARTNLGLGSAAIQPSTAFDAAGTAAAITLAGLGGITPAAVDTKVSTAIAGLVNGASAALDTLSEIDAQMAADEGSAAALAALVAQKADAATIASQLLLAWTLAQAFTVTSATRDTNEAITTAAVVWPDGATGTFTTDTASTAFPGAIDAYHVTHVLGGVTKTVTQTAVTRDAGGAVVNQPALTVA